MKALRTDWRRNTTNCICPASGYKTLLPSQTFRIWSSFWGLRSLKKLKAFSSRFDEMWIAFEEAVIQKWNSLTEEVDKGGGAGNADDSISVRWFVPPTTGLSLLFLCFVLLLWSTQPSLFLLYICPLFSQFCLQVAAVLMNAKWYKTSS